MILLGHLENVASHELNHGADVTLLLKRVEGLVVDPPVGELDVDEQESPPLVKSGFATSLQFEPVGVIAFASCSRLR